MDARIARRFVGAVPYLSYEVDPISFTVGGVAAIAFGYVRLNGDGAWETRTITKVASSGDTTAYLSASPVFCDTGFVRNAGGNFAPSVCSKKSGTYPVLAWFVAPTSSHQFPLLRAFSGNSAATAIAQCAQGSVDAPYTDRINNETAVNGRCSFGTKIVSSSIVAVAGIPGAPVPGNGGSYQADPLTVSKMCESYGYTNVASYTGQAYSSCGNNYHVFWNPNLSTWATQNACAYNSHVTSLSCYKVVF